MLLNKSDVQSFNFHPAVSRWFESRYGTATEPQEKGWPAIQSGKHTLISTPTGSGKTLAAFRAALDQLFKEGLEGNLPDETHVLYVSPLKALSNDIRINLEDPLLGIRTQLLESEYREVDVRTGDTPASKRQAIAKKPPHILVTTPESFYLLLTSESGRKTLSTVQSLIIDEIHAVVDNRRGSYLALSIERLEALVDHPLQRIGLSATLSLKNWYEKRGPIRYSLKTMSLPLLAMVYGSLAIHGFINILLDVLENRYLNHLNTIFMIVSEYDIDEIVNASSERLNHSLRN